MIATTSFAGITTAQTREAVPGERSRYQIELKIDVDALSYSGSERVRWINRGDHATSTLYFHLYSNLRVEGQVASVADEPQIEVTKVRLAATDAPLPFALEEQGTTLRVNLRESVPVNGAVEVALDFRGNVPEVDPEESAITTHVIKQVSAALRDEREMRRARDLNFRCRGVMLLGSAYPVLAVHDGDEWRRRLEPGIGDIIFNESADYEVTVSSAPGVNVFASGTEEARDGQEIKTFSGFALRDFAIVAGRGLRSEQTTVGQTTLRSVFLAEHERVGKHVLSSSAAALRVFSARFGSLPYKTITVAEAPLVAGLGSTEFSGLLVIASAFYVDFDSPAMRNLPEIIREQRPAVEQSLEWTVAHLLAHQWWGTAVGNDPAREPVLDEALACWSALLYYEAVHGKEQAAIVQEDQLLGVYRLYRTFGGEDMDANRASRDYRNSFQYAAIVATKGAMMFVVLRNLLGDEKFFAALSSYYKANQFEIARLEDLQGAFIAESPLEQRRTVARTFNRWLESKRGDEDIAKPDQELAASLGIPSKPNRQKKGDRTALSAFAKLGKFFWQQMTRIR
ncbi:MAG TPA: M1 family aminopeptidase [Pyrinomonadaceae bacterium]|nr:M1 family aminopeptidase [Pyrinomonadaceae bacterium]